MSNFYLNVEAHPGDDPSNLMRDAVVSLVDSNKSMKVVGVPAA